MGEKYRKDELEKANESLKRANKIIFFFTLLIALVSIGSLVINIVNGIDNIILNIGQVALMILLVGFTFRNFAETNIIEGSKSFKVLKIGVSFLFFIALSVVSVFGIIIYLMIFSLLVEMIFVKGEYILYSQKSPYVYILLIPVFMIIGFIMTKYIKFKVSKKIILSCILLTIAFIYIGVTNVVVITEEGIYDYSSYNLSGTEYSYEDIKIVETGFETSGAYKGEFYYNIELSNGTNIELDSISPSDEFEMDTWGEYIYLDEKIMEYDVLKHSSEAGVEHNHMDQKYIDKLLKVIRNK